MGEYNIWDSNILFVYLVIGGIFYMFWQGWLESHDDDGVYAFLSLVAFLIFPVGGMYYYNFYGFLGGGIIYVGLRYMHNKYMGRPM